MLILLFSYHLKFTIGKCGYIYYNLVLRTCYNIFKPKSKACFCSFMWIFLCLLWYIHGFVCVCSVDWTGDRICHRRSRQIYEKSRVFLQVFLQSSRSRESLVTTETEIWFLSRVFSNMKPQALPMGKRCCTLGAGVRSLACVYPHVDLQATRHTKSLCTLRT